MARRSTRLGTYVAVIVLAPVTLIVVGSVARSCWPVVLFASMLTLLLWLSAVIYWIIRPGDQRRRKLALWLSAVSVLVVALLPFWMWWRAARATYFFAEELDNLVRLGGALQMYSEDWGELPSGAEWQKGLAHYLHGSEGVLQRHYHDDGAYYNYVPPRPDADPGKWVVIEITDWEDRFGTQVYVYGSGEVEKRHVWPWWKYIRTGNYLFPRVKN